MPKHSGQLGWAHAERIQDRNLKVGERWPHSQLLENIAIEHDETVGIVATCPFVELDRLELHSIHLLLYPIRLLHVLYHFPVTPSE